MESRLNRRALIDGISRMLQDVPYRLLEILYALLKYLVDED